MTDTALTMERPGERRAALLLPLLAFGCAAAFVLSVAIGPVGLSLGEIVAAIAGTGHDETARNIVLDLRIPRSLMALAVGAGLGAGGAAMQGLFRNPLADPTLIGVSGGAALFAASFIVFGGAVHFIPEALRFYGMPGAAFIGAVTVVLLIKRLSQREGRTEVATMLLAGIAVNAVVMAGIGLLTFVATDAQLRTITFWNLGSLGGSGWRSALVVAPITAAMLALCLVSARALDAMMLGEREAHTLGFDVETAKRLLVIAVAGGVGAATAFTGMIVFVGIVAPHMVRIAIGPSHRRLVIGAALLGALLILLADVLCRIVIAPAELPIGVVTSLIGAPFFLGLLLKGRREGSVLL
ncbi:MAG TPA: iron ABC transporter permease [Dongiaceae bacterium]|nr:iron ABC transporter permease [Dongiaceae bacterium]